MDDFNRICVSLPAVKCLTDERKKAVRARSAEHGAESLREVFEKAENSDFLCGRNPTNATISGYRGTRTSGEPWRASFDWLLNKANFVKVLEGNYEPKPYERSDLDDYFDSIKCKT
ncbi:MAG TPA: hypothetical protein PK854_05615 [Oscillospiraceae bacterium]|nr:hypothetical protein [Oscillospiraceae bacterium]